MANCGVGAPIFPAWNAPAGAGAGPSTLPDGLIAYYALEAAGDALVSAVNSPALDIPGSGGVVTTGKNSNGLRTEVGDGYYENSASSKPTAAAWTFNAWVKVGTAVPSNSFVIMNVYTASYAKFGDIRISNVNPYPFQTAAQQAGSANITYAASPTGAQANTWFMVTGGAVPATDKVWIVVNANFDTGYTEETAAATLADLMTASSFSELPGGGQEGYVIDEIGVWGRRLSNTEITELYNAGAGKFYPFS